MAEIADLRYSPSGGRLHSRAAQAPVAIPPAHPLLAGYVQSGVVREIAPTLRALDLDPDPIIKAAGLDPHVFDDGTSAIPYGPRPAVRFGCRPHALPAFRAHVRQPGDDFVAGAGWRLMLHSETFGDAVEGSCRNLSVQDRVVVPRSR